MKLRIISDGTARGTKVVNAETLEPIEGITGLEWKIGLYGRFATVKMELRGVSLDVIAELIGGAHGEAEKDSGGE